MCYSPHYRCLAIIYRCVCLLGTGCCPCNVHCAAMCTAGGLFSYPRFWFSRRGRGALSSFLSAECPAGVATLGCRATAACLLVCKQQLICTLTTSQLVSVRTCVCFAFCSSMACEQDVTDPYIDHISAGECARLRVLCFLLFSGL